MSRFTNLLLVSFALIVNCLAQEGSAPSTPLQFVPVTPCRLVDTRPQNGGSGPIQGGTFESFNLPQLAQQNGCASLSSAAAYLLNVTVIPQGSLHYLTVYPTGENRGVTTTMNSLDGRVKADSVTVPAGTNQAVSVYVSDTTNVVIDIYGYYTTPSQRTLQYYPLPPCRVVDTRNSNFPQGLGPPSLTGGVPRDLPVLSSTCFIPSSSQAYSFNVTVLPKNGNPLGYLTVWPAGQSQPNVAILVDLTGTVVSNAAVVPAGTAGNITVYASNDTDLVIDINGIFAPSGTGGLSLYPTAPCRALDTRYKALGFSGELTIPILAAPGRPCVPNRGAQAFVFNVTAYPQGSLNYLTLWADGQPQPGTWTLNAVDGAVTSNMAIVSSINGSIDAYASGTTQLTLDISSYFAP